MVLDDEVEITKAIARELRHSAQVATFNQPLEALESFEKNPYSVVLSDLQMPQMNGLEFLRRCAELRPESYRILVTAFADLANLNESINKAKLNFIITKPWESKDLQNAVETGQRYNELQRENLELRRIALTDALTNVSNHRYFWERLEAEFSRARRYGRPLSLIMADVDDFKKYNDTHGHQKGDSVLKTVAQNLQKELRSMDTVARYGGEEFALILPETTRPVALEIARRKLEACLSDTGVSLSLGVASYPDDAGTPTELVHLADRALLKAKAQGKAQVLSALDLTE